MSESVAAVVSLLSLCEHYGSGFRMQLSPIGSVILAAQRVAWA